MTISWSLFQTRNIMIKSKLTAWEVTDFSIFKMPYNRFTDCTQLHIHVIDVVSVI